MSDSEVEDAGPAAPALPARRARSGAAGAFAALDSGSEDAVEPGAEPLYNPSSDSENDGRRRAPRGRGRMPNKATDDKYIEAVQRYGRDFKMIASYMGRATSVVAQYWERHCVRLDLDLILSNRSGSGDGSLPVTADSELDNEAEEDGYGAGLAPMDSEEGLELSGLDLSAWQGLIDTVAAAETAPAAPEAGSMGDAPGEGGQSDQSELPAAPEPIVPAADRAADVAPMLAEVPAAEVEKVVALLQPGRELAVELDNLELAAELAGWLLGDLSALAANTSALNQLLGAITRVAANQAAAAAAANSGRGKRPGRRGRISYWSTDEKEALIAAYSVHGRDWDAMQAAVPTKTMTQVRNFYQNYKAKVFDPIALPATAVIPGGRKRKSAPSPLGPTTDGAPESPPMASPTGRPAKRRGRPPKKAAGTPTPAATPVLPSTVVPMQVALAQQQALLMQMVAAGQLAGANPMVQNPMLAALLAQAGGAMGAAGVGTGLEALVASMQQAQQSGGAATVQSIQEQIAAAVQSSAANLQALLMAQMAAAAGVQGSPVFAATPAAPTQAPGTEADDAVEEEGDVAQGQSQEAAEAMEGVQMEGTGGESGELPRGGLEEADDGGNAAVEEGGHENKDGEGDGEEGPSE